MTPGVVVLVMGVLAGIFVALANHGVPHMGFAVGALLGLTYFLGEQRGRKWQR